MSFESLILTTLRASAAVIAEVPAAKIYFAKVPQGTAAPFIGCFRIGTLPSHTSDNGLPGRARLDNISLQVTVYGLTEAKSLVAADAIRGEIEAVASLSAIMTDQIGTFDDPTELQGQILTFSCWYPGASPS